MFNHRERILLLATAAILVLLGLHALLNRLFLRPLESQGAQIRGLTQDIAAKQKQLDEALLARSRLADWERISFPSDPRAAQALYQEFLFKLTQDCHLEEGVVAVRPSSQRKYSTRIPFTVTGRISLENLTEFLYRFYQPDLLQQTRSVSIRRAKDSQGKLEITLLVEGLVMHSAPSRGELVPEGAESVSPILAGAERKDFALISRKNIFEPFGEPPKRDNNPELEAAQHLHLTACIDQGEGPTAWLHNRLTDERWQLHPSDALDGTGVKGKLLAVEPSHIVLEIDGQRWILDIGKSLSDKRAVGPAQAASRASR